MSNPHFLADVDESWTLFLDRDGVINRKLDNDYVKSISEMEILEGVLEALYTFDQFFYKIVIVTNQQCISKGIISEYQLSLIHGYMMHEVENARARIDAIYFCPHLKMDCTFCRKPNSGMAHMAKADFPLIDFTKSIIVGDSDSDIEFGFNVGMHTVKIGDRKSKHISKKCDIFVPSLVSFSNLLKNYKKYG
jgi:histidinol-phosphate phosphatase family protein